MRFIAIRHGKTENNDLQEKSYELYTKNRSKDPELCKGAQEQCEIVGNFLKSNNIINKNNNDKIIKESNQFIIDIQKNNYGINQSKNTKSTINISVGNYHKKNNNNLYLNDSDKLNVKTKENLNRLDKIRDQIGKLLK